MRCWILAAFLVGCGGPLPDVYFIDSVFVIVHGTAPGYTPDRVRSLIDRSVSYWGGSKEALIGYTIEVFPQDSKIECGGGWAIGCHTGRHIWVKATDGGSCPEASPIIHEIGHAVIRDVDHKSEGWRDDTRYSQLWSDLMTAPGCEPLASHGWRGFW